MKTFPVLFLTLLLKVSAIFPVDYTPSLSNAVAVPVTTNSVFLNNPSCVFSPPLGPGTIWLVAARDQGMATFNSDKSITNPPSIINLPMNPTAFNPGNKNYILTQLGPQSNYCPAPTPTYFQVGAQGACNTADCNIALPEGSNMSFKYLLLDSNNNILAETKESDKITLKTVKNSGSLGSGYAGRSAAMVVITSILSVAAALLLLLLLIALILACCYKSGKTQTYATRREPSVLGSLRIPSYDVHHLKNPSPYDNPAYEQDLIKKRYTTNSTLPQKTTTVITTVQNNPPDTITLQKM